MQFDAVYYEPASLDYELGRKLKQDFQGIPWIEIDNHNSIAEMRAKGNADFPKMKRNLIVGIRKTHAYTENHKISDYLVPYTSSGCTAMCLYCYLVCNYNKCAYLRLFVNREKMLLKLMRAASVQGAKELTFEIGSNSDLVLENTITENLEWTIPRFAKEEKGFLTFPTKFHMVEPLLGLDHRGRVIFRMSVNPPDFIRRIELGTSPLEKRIDAVNRMCRAGYPTGLLIAPIILTEDWKAQYSKLFDILAETLSDEVKGQLFLELIFMTYSYIHRAINAEAFPNAPDLYRTDQMAVRGRGKYGYRVQLREEAETFLREQIGEKLKGARIVYVC